MIYLLQEVLQYIEKQQKLLEEVNVLTTASREQYKRIQSKLAVEIAILLGRTLPEIRVKTEDVETNTLFVQHVPSNESYTTKEPGCNAAILEELEPLHTVDKDFESDMQPNESFIKSDIPVMGTQPQKSPSSPKKNVVSKGTTSKPYQCDICNTTISDKRNLGVHMLTHTGEKPFPCHVCGRGFTTKANMRRHLVVHTGEKPFKCKVCGKESTQPISRDHLISHGVEMPFQCEICNERLITKRAYRKHTTTCRKANNKRDSEIHIKTEDVENGNLFDRPNPFTNNPTKPEYTNGILEDREQLQKDDEDFESHVQFNHSLGGSDKWIIETTPGTPQPHQTPSSPGEEIVVYKGTPCIPVQCDICNVTISDKRNLGVHMLTHTGEKPFPCHVCGRGFTTKANMRRHLVVHTGEKPFKCKVCGKESAQPISRFHMLSHDIELPFKCDVCDERLISKRAYKKHIISCKKAHKRGSNFYCRKCGIEFKLKDEFVAHFRNRCFKCKFCKKAFKTELCQNHHERRNHGQKLKKLRIISPIQRISKHQPENNKIQEDKDIVTADNSFHKKYERELQHKTPFAKPKTTDQKDKNRLSSYQRMDKIKNKKIMLRIAMQSSSANQDRGNLGNSCSRTVNITNKNVMPDNKNTAQCKICNKIVSSKSNLDIHMLTHTKEKPFECHVCGNRFSLRSNMRRHLVVHTGEKPYKCRICGFASPHPTSRRHMLTHNIEFPYKCDICERRSMTKRGHQRHIEMCKNDHKRGSKFYCNKCEKYFDARKALIAHIGTPCLKCNLCGYAFMSKRKLQEHRHLHGNMELINNTATEPPENSKFKCEHCEKEFIAKVNLIRHIALKHSDGNKRSLNDNDKKSSTAKRMKYNSYETTPRPSRDLKQPIMVHSSNNKNSNQVAIVNTPLYECDICDEKFLGHSELYVHYKIHKPDKPINCIQS